MADSVRMNMNEVETRQSSLRQTPNGSFGAQFKNGLAQTATVVGGTAQAAGYAIPGASVVGAAISQLGQVRDTSAGTSNMAPNSTGLVPSNGIGGGSSLGGGGSATLAATGIDGSGGVGGGGGGGYLGQVANSAQGGNASSQLLMATQQMTELNQTFNLQYLQLQEKMQQENREFSAMSNVMKAKSDTAKNSLSNLK
jgi:hypothetical protein